MRTARVNGSNEHEAWADGGRSRRQLGFFSHHTATGTAGRAVESQENGRSGRWERGTVTTAVVVVGGVEGSLGASGRPNVTRGGGDADSAGERVGDGGGGGERPAWSTDLEAVSRDRASPIPISPEVEMLGEDLEIDHSIDDGAPPLIRISGRRRRTIRTVGIR